MKCAQCGKEIPDGENDLCENCQKKAMKESVKETTEKNNNETGDNVKQEEEVIKQEENKVNVKQQKNNKKTKEKKTEQSELEITKNKEKSKKTVFSKVLILAIIMIILVAVAIIVIFSSQSIKLGNTIGNIKNYGYATIQGKWIYYLCPNEDSSKVGIFKIKTNGEAQQELYMGEGDILSLNVSDDYIYFVSIGQKAFSDEDTLDNKIYRMKTDGSDLEVINNNEFNNDCYEVYVVADKIYYIGVDSNVYKMNLDGSYKELVADNGTGYLGITDKYIIYNVAADEEETAYYTYIMNIDGSDRKPIIENERLYSINVDKDNIYYTNKDKKICKVKTDGTEQTLLYDITAYNMNYSKGYIYYLNYADQENSDYTVCIYRVKADGSSETPEKIKELETYSSFINVIGDWIIYMDSNETEGFINLVKIDGSDTKQLFLLDYSDFYNEENDVPEATTTETDGNTTQESTAESTSNTNNN